MVRKLKNRPTDLLPEVKIMLKKNCKFIIRNNLLHQKCESTNHDRRFFQFVLPTIYRKQALEACHDGIGHLGIQRTEALLKDRFYWRNMDNDIVDYIKTCPQCLQFKAVPERAELNPIMATRPMELVHIEYLTIESK